MEKERECSREWLMINELMGSRDDMTPEAEAFIIDLFNFLDPHAPFLDQQSEKQHAWLYSLYEKICNEDEEAAQDIFDDAE